MDDGPNYWTIRIGDSQTREAFSLERAEELYDDLCRRMPKEHIEFCEVWIKPVKQRASPGEE